MLKRILASVFRQSLNRALSTGTGSIDKAQPQFQSPETLSKNIEQNLRLLKKEFALCSDVIFREITISGEEQIRAIIVFIKGLVNSDKINGDVINSVLTPSEDHNHLNRRNAIEILDQRILVTSETQATAQLKRIVKEILIGNLALIVDGSSTAIIASTQGGVSRNIEEPNLEPAVRGPRDGFVENITTNISLIRRRIITNLLKVEYFTVGSLTETSVALCYLDGIANPKVVTEVKSRIERINIDTVMSSSVIEEFIMDKKITLFPLIQYTERPDTASNAIIEGQVVIIVDNTPMVLIAPITFNSLLQAAEDYYNGPIFSSLVRVLRFVGLNIALLLPAVTVAAFSYHQELIPTPLISTVAVARQELPFPIFVEILLMELTFELLREAGVRLPKNVGQAISTVGGLVIGDAAVNAGLIAPLPVIVVALTAIASFTIPNYAASFTIRTLRFGLIILAGILGGIGIMFGLMMILVHVCSLRSFGIPYMSPFAPLTLRDLKDTFIRAPWWAMLTRPRLYAPGEPLRQNIKQGPQIPPDKGGKRNE